MHLESQAMAKAVREVWPVIAIGYHFSIQTVRNRRDISKLDSEWEMERRTD